VIHLRLMRVLEIPAIRQAGTQGAGIQDLVMAEILVEIVVGVLADLQDRISYHVSRIR